MYISLTSQYLQKNSATTAVFAHTTAPTAYADTVIVLGSLGHVQDSTGWIWEGGKLVRSVRHCGQKRRDQVWRCTRKQAEGGRKQRSRRQPQLLQFCLLETFRFRPSVLKPDFHLQQKETDDQFNFPKECNLHWGGVV